MSKDANAKAVVHVINGLGLGGAETMLYNVVKYKDTAFGHRNIVVSLGQSDHFAPLLQELGAEVVDLDVRRSPFSAVQKFIKVASGADIVCSWSYHTNLLSLLTKLIFRHRLVWIINHEDTARETNKLTTWLFMYAGARLSRFADGIAYNGSASMKSHVDMGYSAPEQSIVPNGCDTDIYSPTAKSDDYLIDVIGDEALGASIVLSAGRWHPIKDHETFLQAFAQVVQSSEDRVVGVLCGPDVDEGNPELVNLVEEYGLRIGKDVFLMGPRDDLPQLMANSSVFVLHSKSEAFPNVLIQAMSSGTKVVSTNVGIVPELTKGAINPIEPGDSDGLAKEILVQLQGSDKQLDSAGRSLRQIIVEGYSINSVVPLYEKAIFDGSLS